MMLISGRHRLASATSRFSKVRSWTAAWRGLANGKGGNDDESSGEEDPFGLGLDDASQRYGQTLPPLYKRDTTTGRMTGEILTEITAEEKAILQADDAQRDALLEERLARHYQKYSGREDDDPLMALGRRVREQDMGLNVLGRTVKSQAAQDKEDKLGRDAQSGFSQHLTAYEFDQFRDFLRQTQGMDEKSITEDDIPVLQENQSRHSASPEERELTQKWFAARDNALESASTDQHHPYSDLMPQDMSPSRIVSRKRAKPIPVSQLHQNNLALLQSFLTPTGQIQNRVQTRLGARDQRRVSKLIKRARSMGLIPYMGQWKPERHGWINAKDISEEKPWEKELRRRGLVVRSATIGQEAAASQHDD